MRGGAVDARFPRVGYAGGLDRHGRRADRPLRAAAYAATLAVSVTALNVVNSVSNADIGGQLTLALLLAVSAALGVAAPRLAWLSGLVVGAALGVGGLAILAAGGALPLTMHPPGAAGAVSLLVLVLPALLAASGGAALRRAATGNGRAARPGG